MKNNRVKRNNRKVKKTGGVDLDGPYGDYKFKAMETRKEPFTHLAFCEWCHAVTNHNTRTQKCLIHIRHQEVTHSLLEALKSVRPFLGKKDPGIFGQLRAQVDRAIRKAEASSSTQGGK